MSEDSLNQFGDTIIETTGDHGSDISSQRIDGLDEAALRYALDIQESDHTAIDIGGGLGSQGFRFSTFGIDTTIIDQLELHDWVSQLDGVFEIGSLDLLQKDVRDLTHSDIPDDLKLIYSQRFIHYLTWGEAYELLELLFDNLEEGGQIFI